MGKVPVSIANQACDLLLEVLERNGWKGGKKEIYVLKRAFIKYINRKSLLNQGLRRDSYSAVLNRTALLPKDENVFRNDPVGQKLREASREFIETLDSLGALKVLLNGEAFSIVVSGETITRMHYVDVRRTLTTTRYLSGTSLRFQYGYGRNLEQIALVIDPDSERSEA